MNQFIQEAINNYLRKIDILRFPNLKFITHN